MSDKQCESCRFWLRVDSGPEGECRRLPPVLHPAAGTYREIPAYGAYFPVTDPDTWCGEFRAKDEPTDTDRIVSAVSDLHESISAVETAVIRN